jgi:hypothetical protein
MLNVGTNMFSLYAFNNPLYAFNNPLAIENR